MGKIILFEIICYWLLVANFGFWKVTGYYWLPTAVAIILLILFGPFLFFTLRVKFLSGQLMREVSEALSHVKTPIYTIKILNTLAVITGLVFLLVPFISTRLVGFSLVLPGLRHLLLWKFSRSIYSKIKVELSKRQSPGPGVEDATSGVGGFSGFKYYYKSYGPNGFSTGSATDPSPHIRDVTGTDKNLEPKLITQKIKSDSN